MSVPSSFLLSRTISVALRVPSQRPCIVGIRCYARPSLASRTLPSLISLHANESSSWTVACHRIIQASRTRYESILKLVPGNVWHATHRSSNMHGRGSSSPFSPRPDGWWRRFRQRLEMLPSEAILYGILGINALVFMGWYYADMKRVVDRNINPYIWMMKNFTVSMNNVASGRIWTVLTACFSHENAAHLLVNCFTYYFMAPTVLALLGNTRFLALYLGGGVISSVASLFFHNTFGNSSNYSSHGASGAIYSVISFFACVAPTSKIWLFAVIPVPAWAFVTGIFVWDSYSALQNRRVATDTAGHIGGLMAGILYYMRLRFRI